MALLERDPEAPLSWEGTMPVTNRYTFGQAGERFFRLLKDEGRIYGSRCDQCNLTYVPATSFCERCLSKLEQWIDVGTQGEVHTFTILATNYDGTPSDVPEIIVLVKLGDGGLIHKLSAVDPEQLCIGMQVEAVIKPDNERTGSILDIEYFRPV